MVLEYTLTGKEKNGPKHVTKVSSVEMEGCEFNYLESETEYKINIKDAKTKQIVSNPIILKTEKSPSDTKTLAVSDKEITIDPIKGYNYYLKEP